MRGVVSSCRKWGTVTHLTYLDQWLANPDGAGTFTRQRDLVLAHDRACPSLREAWMPRRKGVSCPSDLMECHACGITFFREGLTEPFSECMDANWFFCDCCAKRATACPCGDNCVKDSGQVLSPPSH